MELNKPRRKAPAPRTHEGAVARRDGPLVRLRNAINAHMLFQGSFYIDGDSAADVLEKAVIDAVRKDPLATNLIIIEARSKMNIRHAPLAAAVIAAKNGTVNARGLITDVIQRVDEIPDVLALAGGKNGMTHAIRKGVADAFGKFDEYQFGKYQAKSKMITLRDSVFLTHPDTSLYPLVQKIVDGTLATPDTWEVGLSTGGDKKAVFTDLLKSNKLGAMALLRNLRNMDEAGVDRCLVRDALSKANWSRVLPFRFMSAAMTAPTYARDLEDAFQVAVAGSVFLKGSTAVLVDTSGSMSHTISDKSMVRRHWAGAVLGAAINGDHVDLYQWASTTKMVPNFGSLSTAMSLDTGRVGHGTDVSQAIQYALDHGAYDRMIVLSDMQFSDGFDRTGYGVARTKRLPDGMVGYTINLAAYGSPGLLYGDWTHFSGFSDQVLRYIAEVEG